MAFSRRHPYLFALLVFCAIGTVFVIGLTALVTLGGRDAGFEFGDKVGVIEIEGIIDSAETVLTNLREFRDQENIKAIVLRINSPGGGVGPSQEIYREVKRTRETKKVVASLGTVAASGGYYVAAAADHIMASPGTLTGSIGVIMEFANLQTLFQKIGVSPFVLKSGEFKDAGSPFREMTSEERRLLQEFIDNVHQQFVGAVAEGRKLPEEKVREIADGRILSGEQAHNLGLLDSLGNMEDAIELAARLGGIEGKPSVFYGKKKKFSVFEYLTGASLRELMREASLGTIRGGYLLMPLGGSSSNG